MAKVQQQISEEERKQTEEKMKKGDYNLDDFRKQFAQMAQMGGMGEMMKMMPGMGDMIPEGEDPDVAMVPDTGHDRLDDEEGCKYPDLIDMSRRRRIAEGSGNEPHEVKQFLNHFEQVRGMMRQMASMSMWQKLKMITGLGKAGMFQPGAKLPNVKGDTGHRKTPKERAKERKKNKNRPNRPPGKDFKGPPDGKGPNGPPGPPDGKGKPPDGKR